MKKIATVEVFVLDAVESEGICGGVTDYPRPGYFSIRLSSKAPAGHQNGLNAPVLAHELGHVVAQVAGTLTARKDDMVQTLGHETERAIGFNPALTTKASCQMKLDAEKEAWDFAHMMGIPLGTPEEAHGLESYEKGVRLAAILEEQLGIAGI